MDIGGQGLKSQREEGFLPWEPGDTFENFCMESEDVGDVLS